MVKTAMTGARRTSVSPEMATTSSSPWIAMTNKQRWHFFPKSFLPFNLSQIKQEELPGGIPICEIGNWQQKNGALNVQSAATSTWRSDLSTWMSENSLVTDWLINSMKQSGEPYLFLPPTKDVQEIIWETYYNLENASQILSEKQNFGNLNKERKKLQFTTRNSFFMARIGSML